MIPVAEAIEIILRDAKPLPPEKVSLLEARGRVLAEEISARRDLPPLDNSAMDGYAFRRADLDATADGATLEVIAAIPAGSSSDRELGPRQAAKIMTGAPLPPGADTVVPVEDTRAQATKVEVLRVPARGENVRPAGEDVRKGALVLPRGTLLRAVEVGMLASLGRSLVLVHQRPRVAVIATGDEIVDIDGDLEGGRIINSNSYGLAAQVQEAGGIPLVLGIGRDDPAGLLEMFERASGADVILTTGGVSMGDYDYVKQVMADWGVAVRFWKVAMKPGKPLVFGLKGSRPVLGLPGNPVSAMVSFEQFVRPLLRRMQGHGRLFRPAVDAVLGEEAGAVRTKPGRMDFVRCRVERTGAGYRVVRVKKQGSGMLTTLVDANGLMVFPEDSSGAVPGELVRVQIYDPEVFEGAAPDLEARTGTV
jgi:molybdopterin molybdotransferase